MDTLANSREPDEMPHDAAFHQGLNCLLRQTYNIILEIVTCESVTPQYILYCV